MAFFRSTMVLALSLIAAPPLAAEPLPAAPATEDGQPVEPRCDPGDRAPECGPGIWIGPLAICGSQLVDARLSQDEWSGLPVLIIDLDGPLRDAFAELTTKLVGHPLPLRFNGKTVIAPIVNEPITAGSLQISGSTLEELKALQTTLRQCTRSDGATL